MQDALIEVYRDFVDSMKLACVERRIDSKAFQELSAPFLIKTDDEYQSARPRIAIIGQETCGWAWSLQDFLNSKLLNDALRMYEDFDFGREYRKTPFWNYFHDIRSSIFGQDDPRRRIVGWLNLFKFNHDSGDGVLPMPWSPLKDAALTLQSDVFQKEVGIAKPDAMIFFTGPHYDEIIKRFYPDVEFKVLLGTHSERQAAVIVHPGLPSLTFRTYHPAYLCRHRERTDAVVAEIVRRIRQVFPS